MDFGILHLGTEAPAAAQAVAWADIPEFRALTVGCALLILFLLRELYKLSRPLSGCLVRARGNIEIEHNLSTARSRNFCARLLAIPFLLICSRYGLYQASFILSPSRPWIHLVQLAGVLVLFLLLREILHILLLKVGRIRLSGDETRAVTNGIFNYYLIFCFAALPSVCLLSAFGASDSAIRMALWTELALSWVVSLVREGQILRLGCSGLGTILYLCGLEILPAAALIVSGLVF